MTTCTVSDVSIFSRGDLTLANCISSSMDGQSGDLASFPSGQVIQTCMNAAGVSTECSQCWGSIFDGIKTCFVDTCGGFMDMQESTNAGQPPSQQCIDCLTNLSQKFTNDQTSVCGVNVQEMGSMGENIRGQFGGMNGPRGDTNVTTTTTTTGKGFTPVSVRSITTSVFVFTLLMLSTTI